MNSKTDLNIETEQATLQSQKSTTPSPSTGGSSRRRLRALIPSIPPRRTCLMKQMLAALHEAEFAAWQASGGDFLKAMHQPIF